MNQALFSKQAPAPIFFSFLFHLEDVRKAISIHGRGTIFIFSLPILSIFLLALLSIHPSWWNEDTDVSRLRPIITTVAAFQASQSSSTEYHAVPPGAPWSLLWAREIYYAEEGQREAPWRLMCLWERHPGLIKLLEEKKKKACWITWEELKTYCMFWARSIIMIVLVFVLFEMSCASTLIPAAPC